MFSIVLSDLGRWAIAHLSRSDYKNQMCPPALRISCATIGSSYSTRNVMLADLVV